jgi:hypothetical protein
MKEIFSFLEYIQTITGRHGSCHIHSALDADLPRYMDHLYALHTAAILEYPVVLAILKPSGTPSVIEISRHNELLKKRTGCHVVFIADNLDTRTAERLIRRNIPNIIVGKQLYLPFLLLDVKSKSTLQNWIEAPKLTKLSQWAEALLIRQLLRGDLAGMAGIEVARTINMSPMTAQRAISQLTAANLCQLDAQGNRKILRFEDTPSLWDKAKKILTPPCAKVLTLEQLPPDVPTFVSGTLALSQSTLLADDALPVYATSRRLFSRCASTRHVAAEDATVRLELWERDPALTAQGGVVDPISLYLNMRNDEDRVRIALTELLRKHGLGEYS